MTYPGGKTRDESNKCKLKKKGFLDNAVPEAIKERKTLGQRLRLGVLKEKQIFYLVVAKGLLTEGAIPRDRGICRHMYV